LPLAAPAAHAFQPGAEAPPLRRLSGSLLFDFVEGVQIVGHGENLPDNFILIWIIRSLNTRASGRSKSSDD